MGDRGPVKYSLLCHPNRARHPHLAVHPQRARHPHRARHPQRARHPEFISGSQDGLFYRSFLNGMAVLLVKKLNS